MPRVACSLLLLLLSGDLLLRAAACRCPPARPSESTPHKHHTQEGHTRHAWRTCVRKAVRPRWPEDPPPPPWRTCGLPGAIAPTEPLSLSARRSMLYCKPSSSSSTPAMAQGRKATTKRCGLRLRPGTRTARTGSVCWMGQCACLCMVGQQQELRSGLPFSQAALRNALLQPFVLQVVCVHVVCVHVAPHADLQLARAATRATTCPSTQKAAESHNAYARGSPHPQQRWIWHPRFAPGHARTALAASCSQATRSNGSRWVSAFILPGSPSRLNTKEYVRLRCCVANGHAAIRGVAMLKVGPGACHTKAAVCLAISGFGCVHAQVGT